MAFEIKRGDLEPPLEAGLEQDDGTPIDLTTAIAVRTIIRLGGTETLIVDRAATIVDAVAGEVTLEWADGETDTAGPCELEFEITWPGARPQTVPSEGFYTFPIHPDIA